jgi:hypothetical protein
VIVECPNCGIALQPAPRPGAEGRSGPIAVSVDPRTVLTCPNACGSTDDALRVAIGRAVRERLLLATGRRTAAHCGRCGAVLDLPMRATTRSVTVEPDAAGPFTLTFQAPLIRCGECGGDNVPPELTDDLERTALETCGVGRTAPRTQGLLRLLRRRGGPGSPARP